jgi:hypothetical protein
VYGNEKVFRLNDEVSPPNNNGLAPLPVDKGSIYNVLTFFKTFSISRERDENENVIHPDVT